MQYFSATDAKQKFAALMDAAQNEPVIIRKQKRDVAVVLSAREYDRLLGLNIQEFRLFSDKAGREAEEKGMTEDVLAGLLAE